MNAETATSEKAPSGGAGITIGRIVPEPTAGEREAIRLALEQIAGEMQPPAPPLFQSDSKWRFSGRWWNQGSLAGQARRF